MQRMTSNQLILILTYEVIENISLMYMNSDKGLKFGSLHLG